MTMGKFTLMDGSILNLLFTIYIALMMATSAESDCPTNFDVGTGPDDKVTVEVTFDIPINQTCIPEPGGMFPIGSRSVTCTGDGVPCSFTFVVVDTSPPVFLASCEQTVQKHISYDPSQPLTSSTAVTWEVPQVSDNAADSPILTSTKEPGDEFSIGSTEVMYTATDSAGNMETCNFTVQVLLSYTPPKDRIFVKNHPVNQISCLSVTWPEDSATTSYSIYVYKEGEGKPNSKGRIVARRGSSTYMYTELCKLQAGQLYVVEVESVVNGKVRTASAREYTAPLPPTALRALPGTLSPSSMVLSWTRSQQNVDQYEVSTETRVQYVSKTTDRVEIDSLLPGVNYGMTVKSVVGSGKRRSFSNSLFVGIDTADARESELIAVSYTESTIAVRWKAVIGNSDELNPYMLMIEPQDAFENFLRGSNSGAQFQGLKPNTNYHIQLLSNLGFHLETTQKTRPGRVGNLRAVKVLDDFITLTWDSPTEGDVDSYDVSISPGNRSEPTNVMGNSFDFSSLANETEYFISVVSVYKSMKSNPQTTLVTTGVTKPVPNSLEYVALAVGCVLGALVVTQLIVIVIICLKCRGIKTNALNSHFSQQNAHVYDDTENVQGQDSLYETTAIGPVH